MCDIGSIAVSIGTDVVALYKRKIAHQFDIESANLNDHEQRDIYSVN